MKAICGSHKGLVRSMNQDWVEVRNFDDLSCLVVVCDGIGGSAGGEVASKEAALEIVKYFENHLKDSNIKDTTLESVKAANDKILQISKSDKLISRLGTTSVISFVKDNMLHVANVGDSRAYIISENKIAQITEDHSVVNELVIQGKITPDEAKNAPHKNVITRALGYINFTPDYYSRKIENGERILLCTDGLTNCLSDKEIHQIVINNDPEKAIDILISESNKIGGPDNITVSIIF